MAALACPITAGGPAAARRLPAAAHQRLWTPLPQPLAARRSVLAPRAQSTGRPGSASFQGGGAEACFGRPALAATPTERPGAAAAASAGDAAPVATAPTAAAPAKKASKPRLPALDSLRFFLIAYIGVGHFVAFATKDALLLKLFSQV